MMPFTVESPLKVVFLYKPFHTVKDHLIQKFQNHPNIQLIFPEDPTEEKLLEIVPDADVLITWNTSEKILRAAKSLKFLQSPYTGIDHLSRTIRKIKEFPTFKVANAHGISQLIAQHAVAMLLGITNHLIVHHRRLSDGIWIPGGEGIREDSPTIPIAGRTIGLLGYGAINSKVHAMLANFNAKFAIMRRSWKGKERDINFPSSVKKYEYAQLTEFLQITDFLIIAAPLTKKTKHMLKEQELKLLGSKNTESIIVNVGRADIIEETALYNALKEKIIDRAALDVFYIYRTKPDEHGRHYPYSYPFHELENVLVSPHRADSPFDDLSRWDDIIENLKRFASGRSDLLNLVNVQEGY